MVKVASQYYTAEEAKRAEKFGVSKYLIRHRLNRGWEKEKALTTPPRKFQKSKNPRKKKQFAWEDTIYTAYKGDEIKGTGNVFELAKMLNITLGTSKRCTTNAWKEGEKGKAFVFEEVGKYSEERLEEKLFEEWRDSE